VRTGIRTDIGLYQIIFIVSLTVFLSCCSDGGSGRQKGYFVDGPVEGLSYRTSTQSGQTGVDGSFFYMQGEIVDFYIGNIWIGQTTGALTISPFDLMGITPPETGVEIRRAINMIGSHAHGSPLEHAANIASFLQTIDEDGDPTNGIQIPDQMHSIAAGASIDFNQNWGVFPSDFSLRKLIADARSAGLWGGIRQIRNPGYALNNLYSGLVVSPKIYTPATHNLDYDADGTVDRRETYFYDANGNQTIYEYDSDADGTVDRRETYFYDANGNQTMQEHDSDADGTVDERETYFYDANGNQTMKEYDSDADHTVDSRIIYTYDANGNQTMQEHDYDADGTVDRRETYFYDANGNQTIYEGDLDADGTVDSRIIYTYDANGNKTMQEYDSDADGTVDERETYFYDANGNQTMQEHDSDADGTVDSRNIYTYNANGNLAMVENDCNADGTVCLRNAWDAYGNQTLLQYYYQYGNVLFSTAYTYTYDANGNMIMKETDSDTVGTLGSQTIFTIGPPIPDSRTIYTYDANGNLTMQEYDSDADGTVDSRHTYANQLVTGWMYYYN
jgi:hypothetical protein